MLNQSAPKATNSDKRPRGHRDHFVRSFGGMNCSLAIMSRTSAVWLPLIISLYAIILQLAGFYLFVSQSTAIDYDHVENVGS